MTFAVGFTGTRFGMTPAQKATVRTTLLAAVGDSQSIVELHHGMCIGADVDMHLLVREIYPAAVIHGWPGRSAKASAVDDIHRATITVDVLHDEMTHFARNRAIVSVADILIATPVQAANPGFGGTWYTIDFARTSRRESPRSPVVIAVVLPNGDIAP